MTNDEWIRHIDTAIADAKIGKSWCNPKCLDLAGFSTSFQRRLGNNLMRYEGARTYMEVGLYAGGLFCSTISNQEPGLWAFGFEDFTQEFGRSGVFDELRANLTQFTPVDKRDEVHIINQDFFEWAKAPTQHSKASIFVYDGEHSYESQKRAMEVMYDFIEDTALIIVDDADWPSVSTGTMDGLIAHDDTLDVVRKWHLTGRKPDHELYHNGIFIFLVNKI